MITTSQQGLPILPVSSNPAKTFFTNRTDFIAILRKQLLETQWFSMDECVDLQLKQLSELLHHAEKYSPWFRELLVKHGLTPRKLSDSNTFCRLPTMTKRDIQIADDSLFCKQLPSGHGNRYPVQTSGSTGEPTLIYRTNLNEADWMAMSLRDHDWHRRDFLQRECGIRLHSKDAILMEQWAEPVRLFFKSAPAIILPLSWDTQRLISAIREFQPAYLQLFPSILSDIIKELNYSSRTIPGLKEIRVYGETFDAEARRDIEHYFQASVTNTYSSEEFGKIACQCPLTNCFHVNSEFFLVEILDDDNLPCSAGEVGRIVITDLRNYATPLIRYEIGDYAEVGETCICGRKMLTLSRILGRSRNLMTLPNGNRCWPRLGYLFREFQKTAKVKQFQLTQVDLKKIEVRLVADRILTTSQEENFCNLLRNLTGFCFELNFIYLSNFIPREKGGKFEDFKNLIDI